MAELKRVKLTDEQFTELKNEFRACECISKIIASAIEHAANSLAKREEDAWECVARILECERGAHKFQIDWVTRNVTATRIEDDE